MNSTQIWQRWFLGMLVCLVIVASSILCSNTAIVAQSERSAKAEDLTQQGFARFNLGDAATALKRWQAASKQYRKQGNLDGTLGNIVNQSLALRSLGQFPRMCQVLTEGLEISDRFCFKSLQLENPTQNTQALFAKTLSDLQLNPIRLLALEHLGTALQLIGDLPDAKLALQIVLERVEPTQQSATQLALGNVERAIFIQQRDRFSRSDALDVISKGAIALKVQAETVLNWYTQAAQAESTRIKAQVNQLSFLADLNRWLLTQKNNDLPEIQQLSHKVNQQLDTLLPAVLRTDFAPFSPIDGVYARLNIATSLIHLVQDGRFKDLSDASRFTQDALTNAKSFSDPRATSFSLGTMGWIEQQQGNLVGARSYFNQAMGLAQSIRASDAAYQWQQALAEVAQQQGDIKNALAYYHAAIDSLDQVRNNLLPIAADVQLSFREQVEPIYRNYMSLLIAQADPNLLQIINIYERLKIAELENFLRCRRLPLVSLSEHRPTAVVFYLLKLNSKTIGVIVQAPNRLPYYYSANADVVKNEINGLTFNLQNAAQINHALPDEPTLKGYAQSLYQQLITPAEHFGLLQPQIPLVFVLDNALQGIPVSLLHNGQTYLVNRYPIRLSLGSEIVSESTAKHKQLKALIAALSEANPNFVDPHLSSRSLSPLNYVETEVQAVQTAIPNTLLLNQQFTWSRLENQIQRNQYDIIHLATHGQFSSVPDETFVVAWDQLITAPQLSALLKSHVGPPLDLLVLSACQTAKGDTRSMLGIAGVAAQSGARTTLASLWLVDDAATARLVKTFYKNLKQGRSKAESLQLAQINMQNQNSAYSHPYFWAAFVLVGEA